jgi:hypothetical protein
MTLPDLFHAVNLAGIRLANVDGQLLLRGHVGSVTPVIRAGAAEHKAELLALLPVIDAEADAEREAIRWEGSLSKAEAATVAQQAISEWDAVCRELETDYYLPPGSVFCWRPGVAEENTLT